MEIITAMSIFTRPVLQINLNNLVANYKKLQNIEVKVGNYHNKEEALILLEKCRQNYLTK